MRHEVTITKNGQVPLKDWGVKFQEDRRDMSFNPFLETISEMRAA